MRDNVSLSDQERKPEIGFPMRSSLPWVTVSLSRLRFTYREMFHSGFLACEGIRCLPMKC